MLKKILLLFVLYSTLYAQELETARILKIVDVNQYEILYQGKPNIAKLIGVQHLKLEHRNKAKDLVESMVSSGDTVWIELDSQYRDNTGNLLCYVHLSNGKMLNEEIIKAGYSTLYFDLPVNDKYIHKLRGIYEGNIKFKVGMGSFAYTSGNENLLSGIFGGLNLSFDYKRPKFFLFRTSIGGYKSKTNSKLLYPGDYSIWWIEEKLIIRFTSHLMRPYAGLGFGYYMPSYSSGIKNQDQSIAQGFYIEDINHTFSMNFTAGINSWLPSKNLFYEFYINYLPLSSNYKITITNPLRFKVFLPDANPETINLKIFYVGWRFGFFF